MSKEILLQDYLAGADLLKSAVEGMTPAQLHETPVPGKWSTQQVICHIADFEPVYADRMKRVIVEENPTLAAGDPDLFARLAYDHRNAADEIELIRLVRQQMVYILEQVPEEEFQRTGIHSVEGPVTLETLLKLITNHIPHHVKFIQEKRAALGLT